LVDSFGRGLGIRVPVDLDIRSGGRMGGLLL
jgi:hypothetical protein